jgi:hypothetical protein
MWMPAGYKFTVDYRCGRLYTLIHITSNRDSSSRAASQAQLLEYREYWLVCTMDARGLQAIEDSITEEHRKYLRFPLSLHAECYYNVRELSESCRIVDISSRGLGLELETPDKVFNGQIVLLSIAVDPRRQPVSAIAKLAWVQNRKDGALLQRAGSDVLFMDPAGKELLLEQARAGILSGISGGFIGARV